jgi:hypothetical protein
MTGTLLVAHPLIRIATAKNNDLQRFILNSLFITPAIKN